MIGERFNTWQYQLTASETDISARITLGVNCLEFTSSASVFIAYNPSTICFRYQIEQNLLQSLSGLETPVTPSRLKNLMQEEWALRLNPSFSYVPSILITSTVRPYAQEQSLPITVIEDVAQQLNVSFEIASQYAKYIQALINLNSV
jgi:hypothetical protein